MTGGPSDDGGWLSAAEALSLVSEAMGPYQAPRAIAARAHDGLVRSRAKRFIRHQQTLSDVELPQEFWWAGGEAALEQNWTSGDFSTWINRNGHWRAYGVTFSRTDIEEMLPRRERAPFPRTQPGNYAPSVTCLRELQSALGCRSAIAEQLILRACPAGLVPARCARMQCWIRDRYGENETEDTDVAVPQWFWEDCLDGPDAILNWKSGRFAGSGVVDDNSYKAVISGLEFQVGAIVELEGIEVTSDEESAATRSAEQPQGRIATAGRKRSDQWQTWVAELVARIHDQGIPEGVGSQGQEELIQAVADALAERGDETLSRSTVQPVVQAVLDRLRSAEN